MHKIMEMERIKRARELPIWANLATRAEKARIEIPIKRRAIRMEITILRKSRRRRRKRMILRKNRKFKINKMKKIIKRKQRPRKLQQIWWRCSPGWLSKTGVHRKARMSRVGSESKNRLKTSGRGFREKVLQVSQ